MFKLSVCVLTYNSVRLLSEVLKILIKIADEIIILNSGNIANTINISRGYGIEPIYHPFKTHSQQMNHATSLASHDWVLCMDSDEVLDEQTTAFILKLKADEEPGQEQAWRLSRYWFVLGEQVRIIYPVSSPDFPARAQHQN